MESPEPAQQIVTRMRASLDDLSRSLESRDTTRLERELAQVRAELADVRAVEQAAHCSAAHQDDPHHATFRARLVEDALRFPAGNPRRRELMEMADGAARLVAELEATRLARVKLATENSDLREEVAQVRGALAIAQKDLATAEASVRVLRDRENAHTAEASERLAFGLYVLTQRGDDTTRRDPANERAAAFDRAADAFLEAAGAYHASLAAEKRAKAFRCEVVRDLHLHKDLRPVARSCGKPHKNAEAALACAKRQYGKPGLVRIGTAAAYQGDKLLCMVVTSERDSQRGRTISCSGAWRPVPIVDGKPDAAAFERLTQAGLGQVLLESLRGRP